METKLITISILEDDLFYAEYLKQGLKSIHYPFVTNFYTRDQFFKSYKKDQSDLILLDYKLHNTNGLVVIDEIKKIDKRANVVFISGQKKPEIALKALKKGAMDYLEKNQEVFKNLKKIILKVRIEKKIISDKLIFQRKLKWMLAFAISVITLILFMYKIH